MMNWRLEGLPEQLENAARGLRNANKELAEAMNPTPSLEGEATESSPLAERQTWESEYNRADALRAAPPLCPAPNAPWQDWCHWFDSLDNRVRILEAGPPWRPTTASPTKEARSDAEPCQHRRRFLQCQDCRVVLGWDSPPECIETVTHLSSPSDRPTTTSPVELPYEYANCPACGACLRIVLIHVPDAAASATD